LFFCGIQYYSFITKWIFFMNLEQFLSTSSKKPKLIVIYGPTACGKTAFSIELSHKLETEIISADSRQIYRYLDIGTGKITEEEKWWIHHHMLDILEPNIDYSVGEYKKTVVPIIKWLQAKWKIPILCGGTWLYIDTIIYNLSISGNQPDWGYREEMEKLRLEKGNEFLWEKLKQFDPEYAATLHPNNYRYVMRGIEVIEKTGKSKMEMKDDRTLVYNTLFLTPYFWDRAELYARINARVAGMFASGLIDEVKLILEKGFSPDCFGLNSIGYKEIIAYIDGKISLQEAEELVAKNSRHYAKRQLTWFSRYNQ